MDGQVDEEGRYGWMRMDELRRGWIDGWMRLDQWINGEGSNGWMGRGSMDGWGGDQWMDREGINGWIGRESMDGINGWMEGRGSVDGWTDRWIGWGCMMDIEGIIEWIDG
jgi:hypothetical protein